MVTMKEVGKAAGVSIATVSRVLANAPSVSKETKEKVQAAINDLQYCSNGLARGLRQKQTNLVAVIMEEIENPFFGDVLRGVEDVLSTNSFIPMFFNLDGDESNESSVFDTIRSMDMCGVIIVLDKNRLHVDLDAFDAEISFICLDPIGLMPKIDAEMVIPDYDKAGEIVVQAFLQGGSSNFAYIPEKSHKNPQDDPVYTSFCRASEGKAQSIQYWPLASGERGRQQLHVLMKEKDENPYSLFIHSAMQAAEVLRGLADMGVAVPQDISVICFENTILAKATSPMLTTVGPNGYQMGMVGAQRLLERFQDNFSSDGVIKIQPKLIQRDSSKWKK